LRPFVQAAGMAEQRPYSRSYREGSVVTFIIVGEYGQGNGDLRVYSLVESDTGQGALHPLREKESGDGAVRPVSLAADLFQTPNTFSIEFTLDGVPVGYDRRWYTFFPQYYDYVGSFNSKFVQYIYDKTKNESTWDTLIDEDLYVGADTLTTAILVGTQATGYSVVSLSTPMLDQVSEARSRLRVFHAANSSGAFDLLLKLSDGSSQQFPGVPFKGSTDYQELPYGPVVAELYRSGEQVPFARKRGYLPVDSQVTLMILGASEDSVGIALLVDTDSNYQAVKFWPDAGTTGVTSEHAVTRESKGLSVMVYPNPTHDKVRVSFRLAQGSAVQVELCTLNGSVVTLLPKQAYAAGEHELLLPTETLPAATYLLRLSAEGQTTTQALTIVR